MKKVIVLLLSIIPFFLSAQQDCNYFQELNPVIEKIQINSTVSDFGPAFVENELWYSSFSEEDIKSLNKGVKKNVFYDIFITPADHEGNATGKGTIALKNISSGYHAGPVSYCQKTKELYITLSNFDNPEVKNAVFQKANIRLKIVILKKINGTWSLQGELPYNNPLYSVGHPAISTTGDTIFFSSNKPDSGFGKTDIYMATRQNGVWGKMVNLGETINTKDDEMFPFLYRDNMLIFASNGKQDNKGGLDLYYSCISKNGYSLPVNLTEFNSPSDDIGLVIHPNEKVGYFASNRTGGEGDDDIYKVVFQKKEKYYDLELLVLDKQSMNPISGVPVRMSDNNQIMQTDINGLLKRVLAKNTEYKITTELEGYINESAIVSTVGHPGGTIKVTLNIEKVKVGQVFTLENIFYHFDKWDILPESEIELNKLVKILNDNPELKVELGSHTDSRGTDEYNIVLSQKRSDSAVGYIISKGIDKNRIIAKGYGETQLVNRCDGTVECTEAEHRLNRRTEFKILEMK
ncbi:MAG: OmpA family protein [Sphingobacteriia bacterium]|nr:OmpA family protein [Sphingobacteriia bacterium]